MKPKSLLPLLSLAAAFLIAAPLQAEAQARNKDGSIVTGVLTAQFDPTNEAGPVLPFPTNLFFVLPTPTADLTLNIPVADPEDKSDLTVALNSLDGFSTTEPWVATFVDNDGNPGAIDPSSVVPGQSVRVFEVTTAQFVAVTGVVRELQPFVEYVAQATPDGSVVIVPLQPLAEYTSYMAVLTNDIRDSDGNDATPDQTYFLTKRQEPWVDENGNSTYPLLDDETARGLAALQPITLSMEAAAASQGINPDDIVLSWTVQTMSYSPTLKGLRALAQPAPVITVPYGFDTSAIGGAGFADIWFGAISLPYYLGIPSAENPAAPLTENWEAPPCGEVPSCAGIPLDPTSTNLTLVNPIPALRQRVNVPLLMTVPSAAKGFVKPETGWPVVIFAHGIRRNRTDMLALADAIASQGAVAIAIDFPLHGVVPEVEPDRAPFSIENTPLGSIVDERHFRLDFFNNETGLPGPDEVPDPSGQSFFNLANFQAARDNLRQSIADLSVLALSLQNIDLDLDLVGDLNVMDVSLVGHSYGVFVGAPFAAIEPIVSRAYFNAGGAVLLRTAEAGELGALIRALLASQGILPGTSEFQQFLTVGQTVLSGADPASWTRELVAKQLPLAHITVTDDATVPARVPGAPMGGNDGLTGLLGLQKFDNTIMNPDGVNGWARFLPPVFHESLLSPVSLATGEPALEAFFEMQSQLASFIGSKGTALIVTNPSLLDPVIEPESTEESPFTMPAIGTYRKPKHGTGAAGKDGGRKGYINAPAGWSPVLGAPRGQPQGQPFATGRETGSLKPILGDRQHD